MHYAGIKVMLLFAADWIIVTWLYVLIPCIRTEKDFANVNCHHVLGTDVHFTAAAITYVLFQKLLYYMSFTESEVHKHLRVIVANLHWKNTSLSLLYDLYIDVLDM